MMIIGEGFVNCEQVNFLIMTKRDVFAPQRGSVKLTDFNLKIPVLPGRQVLRRVKVQGERPFA